VSENKGWKYERGILTSSQAPPCVLERTALKFWVDCARHRRPHRHAPTQGSEGEGLLRGSGVGSWRLLFVSAYTEVDAEEDR
jgi:hypothetical protein